MADVSGQPELSEEQSQRVQEVLRQFWGFDTLRPLQSQAIAVALEHRDSLLVMPTGGGKSLCYQVPALVDESLDVVISPLISLMKDQVDGLIEAGVPAAALHSALLSEERRAIFTGLNQREVRLLFVSPERLMSEGFLQMLQRLGVRRFAIDEAHCISQWGHDFRPEYRQLASLREWFPDASFHAFTATATPRVREDIVAQLQLNDAHVFVGYVDRPNLVYRVVPKADVEAQVAEAIDRHRDEAVIVYCISRRETESLAEWLSDHQTKAMAYHAGMSPEQRHKVQEAFASEKLNVVVATVAFGMGIDRSNVRCVIHTAMPKSLEHFQQETGRAGRDGLQAECVLLYSAGDAIKWERLIESSAADAPNRGEVIASAKRLMSHMQRFGNANICRHRQLVEYFGQTYERESCEACDICLGEVESMADATVIAQKIISCVARAGQRFGVGQIVEILQGANTENIRRYNHQSLSTYGLLKEMDRKTLQALVYQLVDQQLLGRSEGEYPTLKLNAASWEVLKNQRAVTLTMPKLKVKKQTRQALMDMEGVDEGLASALRQWRRELAAEHGVPPYVIFADTALMALARLRPTTPTGLAATPGFGAKKVADYGKEICAVIVDYCKEHNLPADQFNAANAPITRARPRVAAGSAMAQAYELFRRGTPLEEVARRVDRALSTVSEYLQQFVTETGADVTPWVPVEIQKRVFEAVGEEEHPRLKPVFEKLNGEVSYEMIRLTLTMRA